MHSNREKRLHEDRERPTQFCKDGILGNRSAKRPNEGGRSDESNNDNVIYTKGVKPGRKSFSRLQGRADPFIYGAAGKKDPGCLIIC